MDPDRLDALLGRVIGRPRGDDHRGRCRRRAPPRALHGARAGHRHPRRARRADRHRPPLRGGVAGRAGRGRLRRVRPGDRRVPPDRRAGVRPRRPGRPALPAGAFVLALGALRAEPRITEAFRTGAGHGLARARRGRVPRLRAVVPAPATRRTSSRAGCPRSTASRTRCPRAAGVADVGCGLGSSSVLLAQAFPRARSSASDYHEDSVRLARKRAPRRASRTG